MVFPGLSPGARSPINRGKPQSPRGVDTVDSALYTNTNTQIQIHKYNYTITKMQIQIRKYTKPGDVDTFDSALLRQKISSIFFHLTIHGLSGLRWIQRQYLHVGKAD